MTQPLIERLCTAARIGDRDNAKIQKLADLCADVDCQMTLLPGLSCLNYPIAIRPIVEGLPGSLKAKWEKEIVRYADEHNDAYPTFRKFSLMIQNQNHPNVSAGITVPTSNAQNRHRQESKGKPAPESELEIRRALKTDAAQDSGEAPAKETTRPSRKKYCIFHGMAGHDIAECHSFIKKTVGEREQWIFEEGLCFRCLSPNHEAYKCKENVRCSICGSRRHPNLLHWDSEERKEKGNRKREE